MTVAPNEAQEAAADMRPEQVRSFTWQSPDGLTLFGREWPATGRGVSKIPVLCLTGLSRNTRDFNDIAEYLQSTGHPVYALDYRGRGRSDWDPDWRNYALPVEEKDIDAAITQLGLERFAVIGTSRGGLHALAMAQRYPPERMAAVILNDVGPHIEMRAIHRIAASLGHKMKHPTQKAAAAMLQERLSTQFPAFGPEHWHKLAGQLTSEREDEYVFDYDPTLAHQLASQDDGTPVPDLWHLYEKLTDRPVLILRGENSDLLSVETCQRMLEMHSNAQLETIPDQGHAPVLWEKETQERIAAFLEKL